MTDTATAPTAPASDLAALGFRLNFFKLIVRDLAAAVDFYSRAFGFEERNRLVFPHLEEVMLALPGDQFMLILYHHTDGRDLTIGTGHGPVGFITRNVDAAHDHLLSLGATAHRPPFDAPGMRLAFVHDPEGHEIELIQIVRPAAAKE